jgi:hypothetical protein
MRSQTQTTWVNETPTTGYEKGQRCLGMLISDNGINLGRVEQQIQALFPERLKNEPQPFLPMFNCCDSRIIPQFNNHPDTTEADVARVLEES